MLWCGVFTTKLWTHSTRRPVAGSMHSGCSQERFSSSSSLVRPGKNSSTSKKGACCSTTGWIVMSSPVSWSLIVEVIPRALSPALAFRLVGSRRPDRLPRVDLGGRRLAAVGRGPVGLIDLGVVLLFSIAPPRERRLVFLLRIGRRRQQRDDRGGGGQCFHGRLMSQRKPGPMQCIAWPDRSCVWYHIAAASETRSRPAEAGLALAQACIGEQGNSGKRTRRHA